MNVSGIAFPGVQSGDQLLKSFAYPLQHLFHCWNYIFPKSICCKCIFASSKLCEFIVFLAVSGYKYKTIFISLLEAINNHVLLDRKKTAYYFFQVSTNAGMLPRPSTHEDWRSNVWKSTSLDHQLTLQQTETLLVSNL